ncbi:helix-turn-helix domain-containing protein, partial [Streptomyces sp. SID2955]|nr:helix-turn-helix domain-containing protein [Streptomyces sp. SID2955]
MRALVVDTAELAEPERADVWVETMAMAEVTQRVRFLDGSAVQGRIEVLPLGAGQLSVLSHTAVEAQRTPKLVRQSDPEMYHAALVTSGEVGIEQFRQSTLLRQGDVGFFDSSHSFETFTGEIPTRTLILQFPKRLLRGGEGTFKGLCGRSLPAGEGIGRVFATLMDEVAAQYDALTPQDAAACQDTALDLLTALLRHHLGRDSATGNGPGAEAMHLRIIAYIDEHLHDPELAPEEIARAHSISVRYLHRIFQRNGTTPRAFVRQRRLDRCRRDLASPALRGVPIHAIAARWGYPQADAFSRAFRSYTGMSPREYRAGCGEPGQGGDGQPGTGAAGEPGTGAAGMGAAGEPGTGGVVVPGHRTAPGPAGRAA